MKRIFLMRHSIPEKRDMPNEQIPLSEEGKALALSKSNVLSNVDRCFSSPYRRAVETAELIVDHPFIVEELHERTIGDAKEDFWLKQYEDYDFHNPGGESLNQVRTRMKMAVDSIVCQMEDDFDAIRAAFKEARETKGMPTCIVFHSLKGKGVSFMENNVDWHGKAPNDEEYAVAMADLDKIEKELEKAGEQ